MPSLESLIKDIQKAVTNIGIDTNLSSAAQDAISKRHDGSTQASLVGGKVPASQLPLDGLSKITVGTQEPSNPSVGDLWIDTN